MMGAPMHDYGKSMPPEMWDALLKSTPKENKRRIIEVCNYIYSGSGFKYPQPSTSFINVCLDAAETSYVNLWKSVFGSFDIPENHKKILKIISVLTGPMANKISNEVSALIVPWYNDPMIVRCHNPSGRLHSLIRYRRNPKLDALAIKKSPETNFWPVPEEWETKMGWSIRFRDNLKAWPETNKFISRNLFWAASFLDVSPKWLLGLPDEANFWGMTTEQERLYDLWSILPDYCRLLIEQICQAEPKEGS